MTRATVAAAMSAAAGVAGLGYYLAVTGKLTADTGWGRRVRPLGPFSGPRLFHQHQEPGRAPLRTAQRLSAGLCAGPGKGVRACGWK